MGGSCGVNGRRATAGLSQATSRRGDGSEYFNASTATRYARCMYATTDACSGPVVVPADSSHLGAVVDLHRLAFGDDGDIDRYVQMVERGECFVALAEDTPVGFAVYDTFLHGHGLLRIVGVHPDHRRQGVAAALVGRVQRQCTTDRLFTATSADNTAMQRTAEALGFELAGHIDGIDDERELIYLKWLR